jgi:hypothetical protein
MVISPGKGGGSAAAGPASLAVRMLRKRSHLKYTGGAKKLRSAAEKTILTASVNPG